MQHLDDRSGRDASVSGTGRAPRRVVERVPSIQRGASTLEERDARHAERPRGSDLNGDPLAKFVFLQRKRAGPMFGLQVRATETHFTTG